VIAFKFLYNINTIKINFPIIALNTACSHKFPIFILGSTEKNNRNACINIAKLFPGILICGRLNGFFDSIDEVINQIHDSKPKLVFLALGSPKQEQCANELLKFFPHTFFVGCGGAIDILSGQKKRAPEFFIDNGLEWLYRLWKEPKRIRRQIRLPLFLLKLIKFKLS
ncbi:MAG: WecB/TagA/CpsF family glycosyltransferase, partial [Algoriphagus sp.]